MGLKLMTWRSRVANWASQVSLLLLFLKLLQFRKFLTFLILERARMRERKNVRLHSVQGEGWREEGRERARKRESENE